VLTLAAKASSRPVTWVKSILLMLNLPSWDKVKWLVSIDLINKPSYNLLYKSSVKLFSDKPFCVPEFFSNHSSKPSTLSALTLPEIAKSSFSPITKAANFF
jgi:hypothetical protein